MTDRYAGILITLDRDIREDDAEAVLAAIRQLRGVLSVKPLAASPEVHIAEERVNAKWRNRLLDIVRERDVTGGETT